MSAEQQLRYIRDVACIRGGGLLFNERYMPSDVVPPSVGDGLVADFSACTFIASK